ncbi:hypothetical protein J7E87_33625 [Streptomyces sp. ISL-1]|uniref:hypothetical protein n=1 Tax=Streptomyces sp. ISL-1 TaxID=2817657 RepID=UPI001BED1E2F|nr:hypothetical protein [Streptomyces sp. ISL-1]MBT2394217.1 hypothetical protein [Streptomyces sp. ISL-1]
MSGPAAGVQLASLVRGAQLGKGGQGTVWAVQKRLINGEWPVVYKEYDGKSRSELRADVLERMVAFLPRQADGTARWLGEHTAWPAALVRQGNDVHGFLMRQIPEHYFRVLTTSPERRTSGFEFLLNKDAYLRKVVGISFTPRQRFQLLLDLAGKLDRLHGLGVVVGDLSPKNLLFSLQGSPSCFLIDCDAMVLGGQWALKPVQTPGWSLPGAEEPTTRAGDVYKFGLLAARLFIGDQVGSDVNILRSADRAVGQLAERSLAAVPGQRPALADWLGPLRSAVSTAPATLARPAPATPTPTVVNSPAWTPPPRRTVPTAQTANAVTATAGTPAQTPAPARTPNPARTPAPARSGAVPPRRPPAARPKKSYGWVFVLVALLVIGVALGSKLLDNARGEDGSEDPGSGATQTREEQAQTLESLLTENDGNRGSVSESVVRVMGCPGGSELEAAKGVFDDAAGNRDRLVGALEEAGLDQLPDGLTADLLAGWKSSAEADRAYSRLATDMADGCTTSRVTSADAWADADRANVQATRAKKDFVAAWNPLAEEYGLRTLSWDEV